MNELRKFKMKNYDRLETSKHSTKKGKNKDNKNILLIGIIIFLVILLFLLLLIIINNRLIIKKLKNENKELKLTINIKMESIDGENEETINIINKYISQLRAEYYNIKNLAKTNNFDIYSHIQDFLNEINNIFLKETKTNDKCTIQTAIQNKKYSTLKKYYYSRFETVFNKYRNKTEESDEYKNKFKEDILNRFSSLYNKKYTKIDNIVFDKEFFTGNALFTINNFIYYCELLNCKNIYLFQDYWFIKNSIYNPEFNITISPYTKNICSDETTLCITKHVTFDKIIKLFNNIYIPTRLYILKDEILSNLKLIETGDDDLYINIRSGQDIFKNKGYSPGSYYQPPLCFYQTIIENFNFSNIYILANGKENPVVDELLKLYKNAQYIHGSPEEDAGIILSAKNLVLSKSSFPIELIKISENIQNLFFYDLIDGRDKNMWHFNLKNLRPMKFNLFVMYPTKEYVDIMVPWAQKEEQFKQMIDEKCNKKFKIIPSDFTS